MSCYIKRGDPGDLGVRGSPGVYEHFEHTADLGLRVEADDLDGLFADGARGLFAMIVEDLAAVLPTTAVQVRVDGDDAAYLFFDWLAELLAIFDTRGLVLGEFDVRVGETGLEATARGEPLDPARHHPTHEVKAITYHGLRVERTKRGWIAEVVVDI